MAEKQLWHWMNSVIVEPIFRVIERTRLLDAHAPPDIGHIVQNERKRLGLTLVQLSERSGISKSMLSAIERGKVNPTFSVVWALTQALGLEMQNFTAVTPPQAVVDHMHHYSTPAKRSADGLCELKLLSPIRSVLPMEWHELNFQPGGVLRSNAHAPGTYEHLTCLEGALRVEVGDINVSAGKGDTLRYYADQPHAIFNDSDLPLRALLVVALPSQYAAPKR